MGLKVPQAVFRAMVAHVTAVSPEEGCGFLAGTGTAVSRHFPVENKLHSPTVYQMAPDQQLQAMLAAEDAGLTLLAIYHSHPTGPATPSPTDIAQATFPDLAYVIITLQDIPPTMRAFSLRQTAVNEMPLHIV